MPHINCDWCGESFYKRPSRILQFQHHFCDRKCWQAYQNRNHKPNTTCAECGIFFFRIPAATTRRPTNRQFCGRKCKIAYSRRSRVKRICEQCQSAFYVPPSSIVHHAARFCSAGCAGTDVDGIEITCDQCLKSFSVVPHRRATARFCSTGCKNAWESENKTGKNNHNWRGGFDKNYGENWARQRRLTIERDVTCRACGVPKSPNGYGLDVHHIHPLRLFASKTDANELSNLIALCRQCHAAVDSGKIACPSI